MYITIRKEKEHCYTQSFNKRKNKPNKAKRETEKNRAKTTPEFVEFIYTLFTLRFECPFFIQILVTLWSIFYLLPLPTKALSPFSLYPSVVISDCMVHVTQVAPKRSKKILFYTTLCLIH